MIQARNVLGGFFASICLAFSCGLPASAQWDGSYPPGEGPCTSGEYQCHKADIGSSTQPAQAVNSGDDYDDHRGSGR